MSKPTELKDLYPVPEDFRKKAWFKSRAEYDRLYKWSVDNPDDFWAKVAEQQVTWFKKWDKVQDWKFSKDEVYLKWFVNGKLNISYNCLDRHLLLRGDQTAILWEGNEPTEDRPITYRELHADVCKFANVLKTLRRQEGRPRHHLPADDPASRRGDARLLAHRRHPQRGLRRLLGRRAERPHHRLQLHVLITCDGYYPRQQAHQPEDPGRRGHGARPPCVQKCVVVKRVGEKRREGRHEGRPRRLVRGRTGEGLPDCAPGSRWTPRIPSSSSTPPAPPASPRASCTPRAATSSTPRCTHRIVFDYHDGEIFFCTADIGWVTGHSYIVYGPLCNGATSVMFEGVPNYPDPGRFWDIVRQAQGQHHLHRPHGHPRAGGPGRQVGHRPPGQARQPQAPRHGGRADQPRGVEVVLRASGPLQVPHRGHLVADRDGRHPHHRPPRRHRHEARQGHHPASSASSRSSSTRRRATCSTA